MMMTPAPTEFDVTLKLVTTGKVEISERIGDPAVYETNELVEQETEGIELHVTFDEDTPKGMVCSLELWRHHMKNEETGRVFHAILAANLQTADLKRLRDYINFLLAQE